MPFPHPSSTELSEVILGLETAHTKFDAENTNDKLRQAYQIDPMFHLRIPRTLRSIVRKHGMDHAQLQALYRNLLCSELQHNPSDLFFMCQILKYAVKRGGNISILQLIEAYDVMKAESVKNEILLAIVYVLQRQNVEELDAVILQRLHKLISTSPSGAARDFVASQLAVRVQTLTRASVVKHIKPSDDLLAHRPKVQAEVVQQHTTKVTHHQRQTQEVKFSPIDVMEMLRRQNQKTRLTINGVKVPAMSDIAGDDRYWYYGTYYEVINLYGVTQDKAVLKQSDKDEYLSSRLFDRQQHCHLYGALGSFFIDRMICNIYSKISARQDLTANTINKLFQCIGNIRELKVSLFGTDSPIVIAELINDRFLRGKKYESDPRTPVLILNIAKKLFSDCIHNLQIGWLTTSAECHPDRLAAILDTELLAMKCEALTAVYNLMSRNNSILSKVGIQIIENCLCDNNKTVKDLAIKIIGTISNSEDVNFRSLFSAYLAKLREEQADPQIVEAAICYITRQTKNEARCKELLTQQTLTEILTALKSGKLSEQCQLACLDIIRDYLQHSFTVGLSQEHLTILIEYLQASTNEEIKNQSHKLILLTADKNKTLPINIVISLLNSIENYSSNSSSFIIMIIRSVLNTTTINFNYLAFKLLDHNVILQEVDEIHFVKRTKENATNESTSTMTAIIIHLSLLADSPHKVTRKTLEYLMKALASKDKQTRIYAAKCLFVAATKQRIVEPVDYAILLEIQSYLHDSLADIAVYTTLFYVESLYQHSLGSEPIPPSHMDYLSQLYVMDELRLGNADYTLQVNQKILALIRNEVAKKAVLTEDTLRIINHEISRAPEKHQACLDILYDYVVNHGRTVSPETIATLESKLDLSESHQRVLAILCGVIKNGQNVGEKTLSYFSELLCKSDDRALRQKILESLLLADSKQDVPDVVFNVLELERAGQFLRLALSEPSVALAEIERVVSAGQQLPLNLFDIFIEFKVISNHVLIILNHVVRNKQCLPANMIAGLALQYDPNSSLLIEVYYRLVKNNQALPDTLFDKLQSSLIDTGSPNILAIFLTQAQQGKCLSKALANKIIAWSIHSRELVTGENTTTLVNSELSLVAMQQACLGAITSLLQQTDGDDYAEQAQQVYLLYLHDTNVSLVQASIEGIKLLIDRNLLSKASIAQIIDYLGVCKNSSLTRQIINLLPKTELSTQQQFAIKLLSINIEDDSQYLEQCSTLAVDGRFFPDNFCRIQQILARSEALRLTALRLLLTCSNIQDIPVGLVETVGVIERVVLRKKSNYSLNKY